MHIGHIKRMMPEKAADFLRIHKGNWRKAWHGRKLHFFERLGIGIVMGDTLCNQELYPHACNDFANIGAKRCQECARRHNLIEQKAKSDP